MFGSNQNPSNTGFGFGNNQNQNPGGGAFGSGTTGAPGTGGAFGTTNNPTSGTPSTLSPTTMNPLTDRSAFGGAGAGSAFGQRPSTGTSPSTPSILHPDEQRPDFL